ncbi:PIG-L family deacetylase [Schnuerera sp. xch1]|uniref:PIG-L deacetylase family protein n=1 Tax=Schnuerera sp. xch1 TaxID=2874283 RepID=UPI001CC0FCA2|nr:PIG-L family deacetylase [Schnuerera sp. xch1]MBZ2176026.1 PIG-L family deacetylase [Schnuerera sp. xch1]
MIKKIVKKVLKYPIRLLNSIYTYFYYKNSLKRDKYEIDDMITTKKEKILVFSPHVDDETIGLGATLLKYKAKDNQMALVYMTDGGGSTTSLSRDKLVEERRKEGYNVKKTYGFDRGH